MQIFLRIENKVYNCYYRKGVVNVLSMKLTFFSYDELGEILIYFTLWFSPVEVSRQVLMNDIEKK